MILLPGCCVNRSTMTVPSTTGQFIAGIGAIVMGSTTYEWVLRNDPEPWSYTVPAWVLTSRVLDIPEGADVRLASGDVRTVYSRMVEAAGGRDSWVVGGGNLAGQFAGRRPAGRDHRLDCTGDPRVVRFTAPPSPST